MTYRLFTNLKRSWATRQNLSERLRQAEAANLALLRTIDEALQAKRELEALNSRMFVNFMTRIQHVRREARRAIEEVEAARLH